jgi:hypothetical protein
MKGNIKKLAVFVIITVIAMFIPVAMASADPPGPHAIRGKYAGTGGGTCLLAPYGFDPTKPGVPMYGALGAWLIQTVNSEGVWYFEGDGTGSVTSQNRAVTLPYTSPSGPVPPSVGVQNVSFLFHYTVTDDGVISITGDPGTYIAQWIYGPSAPKTYHLNGFSRTGTITPDGKTITLNGGAPDVMDFIAPFVDLPPAAQIVCNFSSVLIWQHDIK